MAKAKKPFVAIPWWGVVFSILCLGFGIAACYVSSTYTNCKYGAYVCDQTEECPIAEGGLVNALFASSVALIGLGAFGLLTFGVVPTCMKKVRCDADARCCRDTCAGAFGKILYALVVIVVVAVNVYLLRVLSVVYPAAQTDRPGAADRSYCNSAVLTTVVVVETFFFGSAAVVLAFALKKCWASIPPRNKERSKGDDSSEDGTAAVDKQRGLEEGALEARSAQKPEPPAVQKQARVEDAPKKKKKTHDAEKKPQKQARVEVEDAPKKKTQDAEKKPPKNRGGDQKNKRKNPKAKNPTDADKKTKTDDK
jgi:hypothetical protein